MSRHGDNGRCPKILVWLVVMVSWPALAEAMPQHEYDQRLYLSAGESPDYSRRFQDGETQTNGVLRYEPRYHWRSGDTEWYRWDAQLRAKLLVAAGRPSRLQTDESGDIREDEHYAELRDAWMRRRMLFGQPALSLAIGRQTYKDEEGLVRDQALESLQLNYQASQWRGHLAVGQQWITWRSDNAELDPRDEGIVRLLAGVGQQWRPGHWWDVHVHAQDDSSGAQTQRQDGVLDERDFSGYWAGLRLQGEGGDSLRGGYIVNALFQEGESRRYVSDGAGSRYADKDTVQGYLWMTEFYGRLPHLGWRPSFGIRVASTDSPQGNADGYFQNRFQSNRRPGVADLSTGVLGDLLDYEMHNLAFVAGWYRQQFWPRAELEILAGSLQRKDSQLGVNSAIRNPLVAGEDALGNVLNLAFGWRSFPLAVSSRRQMQVSTRLSFSLFDMGDAYQRAEQIHQVLFVVAGRW